MDMQLFVRLIDSLSECEALVHTGHFCATLTRRVSYQTEWTGNSNHRKSTAEGGA